MKRSRLESCSRSVHWPCLGRSLLSGVWFGGGGNVGAGEVEGEARRERGRVTEEGSYLPVGYCYYYFAATFG